MFQSSLKTDSVAWNTIPCSVLERVRFLTIITPLLFPVSAKRGNFTGCCTHKMVQEESVSVLGARGLLGDDAFGLFRQRQCRKLNGT